MDLRNWNAGSCVSTFQEYNNLLTALLIPNILVDLYHANAGKNNKLPCVFILLYVQFEEEANPPSRFKAEVHSLSRSERCWWRRTHRSHSAVLESRGKRSPAIHFLGKHVYALEDIKMQCAISRVSAVCVMMCVACVDTVKHWVLTAFARHAVLWGDFIDHYVWHCIVHCLSLTMIECVPVFSVNVFRQWHNMRFRANWGISSSLCVVHWRKSEDGRCDDVLLLV